MSLFKLQHLLKTQTTTLGADGAGKDFIWYGATSGAEVTADASADEWLFDGIDIGLQDSDELRFGDADDVVMRWDGTDFDILPAADDSVFKFGNGTLSFDVWFYGNTAADNIIFDASANALKLDGIDLSLEDADKLQFGDTASGDISVEWDGAKLTSGPASGLWAGCPSDIDPDPYKAIRLFDDFLTGIDTGTHWISLDDAATGTNTYGDQRGGSLNVVTAAADNDYHAMQSTSECFDMAADGKELWFEARFRVAEAATNESAWWFGLSDQDTTGGFQANAAGPLASYDGVLMWKDEATMEIDGESSNAGTQDTQTNIATFVTNTWTRVGFHVDATATTAVVTFYYDVSDSGTMTAHGTTVSLTRSGLEPVHALFGVKAGPAGNAETLEVDYVKCVQLR